MRTFLFTLVLLASTASKAQIPDYFGNDSRWHLSGVWSGGINCPLLFYDYDYIVEDSSQSNGYTYYHVTKYITEKYTNFDYGYCGYPIEYSVIPNYFSLRQEGRKIYTGTNPSSLFVTYELNIGDTLPDCGVTFGLAEEFIVSAIDSVLVGNSYRLIIDFNSPTDSNALRFIEGISHEYNYEFMGRRSQFFESFSPLISFEDVWGIGCYSKNGTKLWPGIGSGHCGEPFVVGIEELDKYKIQLYPNPASEMMFLESKKIIHHISIYNQQGQLVINQTYNNSGISVNGLTSGLYFIEVIEKDGSRTQMKFVKE